MEPRPPRASRPRLLPANQGPVRGDPADIGQNVSRRLVRWCLSRVEPEPGQMETGDIKHHPGGGAWFGPLAVNVPSVYNPSFVGKE